MFATREGSRFRTPQLRSRCSKLVVEGKIISEPQSLLDFWREHFSRLAKSNVDALPGLMELQVKVEELASDSHKNEEMLLDKPFSAEEVSRAVASLKNKKAPGPDGWLLST